MTHATDFPWSEESVNLLKERWAAGASSGAIAQEFSAAFSEVSRNSIIGKIHRLGLVRDTTNVAGRPRKDGSVKKPIAVKPVSKTVEPRPPVLAIVRPEPPRRICEPAPEGGVLIHELEYQHCRWPLLDLPAGHGDEMRYCGAPHVSRGADDNPCPYCDAHSRMAYASPRSATQRAADEKRRQAHLQRKRIAA